MALNYVSVAKKILVVAPLPQGALPVMRYRREHEYDMIGKFNMEIFERLNKKKITAVCEVYTMDNWDYTDPKNDICFEVQTGLSHWRELNQEHSNLVPKKFIIPNKIIRKREENHDKILS